LAHSPDTSWVVGELGYHTFTPWSAIVGDSRPTHKPSYQRRIGILCPAINVPIRADLPPITRTYGTLINLVHGSSLQTVTLMTVRHR
jgi:hypothetical protein